MTASNKNTKILVMDDNPTNRKLCRKILLLENYHVIEAEDGKIGLDLVRQHSPDLILLDIMMPEVDGVKMDGFYVLEQIKNDPSLKHIPIIMLTARAAGTDVVQALEMGANDYLKRPFDFNELLARVATLLRLKRAEDELKQSVSMLEHQASLGDLAAGVAHDFNNLLGQLMFSHVAIHTLKELEEELGDQITQSIADKLNLLKESNQHIVNSIELGKVLSTSLLEFSGDYGAIAVKRDLRPLIEETLNIFKRRFFSLNIEVKQTYADCSMEVMCNAGEIRRIILNLITNSLRALEPVTERRIEVSLSRKGDWVELMFRDSGVGISKAFQSRLFEKYFSTKTEGPKSGIGLHMIKNIVKDHKGSIRVQSAPGEGAAFFILFPIAETMD